MTFNDLLCVSVRQVVRHRRRYLGVVMAIALGVAGFITVITMSREVKKNFNEEPDLIGGVTVIRVSFDNQPLLPAPVVPGQDPGLPWITRAGVKEMSLTPVKGGQHPCTVRITASGRGGGGSGLLGVRNFWPQTGRLFGAEDVRDRSVNVSWGGTGPQDLW